MKKIILIFLFLTGNSYALFGEKRKDLVPLYMEFGDTLNLKGDPNTFIFVRNLGTRDFWFNKKLEVLLGGEKYSGYLFKYYPGKKPGYWKRIKPGELGLIGINIPPSFLKSCSETEIEIDITKVAQKGKNVYLNDERKVAIFDIGQSFCENLPLRLQRKNYSIK